MKKLIIGIGLLLAGGLNAQDTGENYLQNWRPNNQDGLNMFEAPKDNDAQYNGFNVRVGGDFALQFQGIDHSTSFTGDTLNAMGTNFNLPTANLVLDVQLADGMRMHLLTYLSSRHHAEAWVKGGYLSIDKLDFIEEGFLSNVMEVSTIRVGMDEINYGDTHFRRSDNGKAIFNPFVGNYIMDAFTTEAFGEYYFRKNGIMAMVGVSNGKLNQSVNNGNGANADEIKASMYFKGGIDKEMSDDLRVRLMASYLSSPGYANGGYYLGGDRAGSRYYEVMGSYQNDASDFSGRFNPRFKKQDLLQVSAFVDFKGLEFFGFYEMVNGDKNETVTGGSYNQIGAELLYRFGEREQWYLGGRYNSVSGNDFDGADDREISRINVGGGWFMTKNVLAKVEYVTQDYSGAAYDNSVYQDGNFSGVVVEAAISF